MKSGPSLKSLTAATAMVPGVDGAFEQRVMDEAIEPTLAALRARGIDYRGFLFCGLMLTPDGPRVLEYNIRFGDPEAQVVLPRVTSDLAEVLRQAAEGDLRDAVSFDQGAAVTVVCASEGYPLAPRTGDVIEGLDDAAGVEGVQVFCAGVDADADGRLRTAGGRVLSVTGLGADVAEARRRADEAVSRLSWPGMHHRTDIGASALT